ncbi:MAG: molybdopterin molybdenumtransferase MoeA, partial [Miltoncostaeaceae bacterium]
MDRPAELDFDEALALVCDSAIEGGPLAAEDVPVAEAVGRRLARDLVAARDLPGCDNSAMDGFAVRSTDGAGLRRVVGESRAGLPFAGTLGGGEAVTISTGAALPAGADAVVPLENAARDGDLVEPADPVAPAAFVMRAGGD